MQSRLSYGTAGDISPITPVVDRGGDGLQNGFDPSAGQQGTQRQKGTEKRCRVNARLVDNVADARNEVAATLACQDTMAAGQGSRKGISVTARVVSHCVPHSVDSEATATAPPHGLQSGVVQSATNQGNDGNTGFFYWLDRFLTIPLDRFIVPGEDVREMFTNFDPRVADCKWTVNKLLSVGSKRVLDSHVAAWLNKKQDRNQITRNLLSLQKDKSVELTVYFRNWVLLKCYSDMLRGEPVTKTDRQHLVQALNQSVLNDFAELTDKASTMIDFYSLSLLYFMGGLPYFEDGVNYHKGITLLSYCPTILREMYFYLSPVSFSPYDYVRFAPVSIRSVFPQQPNVPPETRLGAAMQVMVMSYLQQLNDHLWGVERYKCSRWFPEPELSSELFPIVNDLVAECVLFTATINPKIKKSWKCRMREIDKRFQAAIDHLTPKANNQGGGRYSCFCQLSSGRNPSLCIC
ncbi:hypothetical protein [Endozoicomonas sp. SESOKO1]|uniref:hypothetical protein n=1 Tax=Endozoicomonas sp. SESOKO1 TaxID=2828742 RepID=UPI0021490BEF|nr:hypothetical protein [Endozoicomonas sp. SESOKO1]